MEVMVFELIYDNKRMYFYRRCPSCLCLCRRKDVAAHGGESSLVSAAAFIISEEPTGQSENLIITKLRKRSTKQFEHFCCRLKSCF